MSAAAPAAERFPVVWGEDAPTRACVWCGEPLGEGSRRLHGRVLCGRCGAASTDPWPSAQDLDRAYGTWYRPAGGRRYALIGDAFFTRSRAMIAGRIDEISPPGPVIDVGSGEGVLIAALQRRGRRVLGLERDATAPEVREAAGPEVRDATLEQVEGDGEWAAVVFWHALEHLPAPGAAIREAARLLMGGGVLLVAVPNSDSLQARAFGDRWLHLDLPRHLVHLSERSLRSGLERNGFRVERTSGVRGAQVVIGWLDGLVGSLPGDLRLYEALRRPAARSAPMSRGRRLAAVAAGVVLFPLALACSAVEVALGRSGTLYVEARLA